MNDLATPCLLHPSLLTETDCAICKESYTAGIGFTCSECPDSIGDVVLAAVLGVVALFTVVAVVSYVVSGGGVGGGNIVIGRLTQYVPLQSVKIIVVTWQILTQVRAFEDQ